ncbi:MAG: DUF2182 domain-containing protein [Halopseudomonas aestusnigri]
MFVIGMALLKVMSLKTTTSFMPHVVRSYLPSLAWVTFFVAIMISWWGLLWISAKHTEITSNGVSSFGVDFLQSLCLTATNELTLFGLVAMWSVMSLAMMAPTAVPMLKSYQDILIAGKGKVPAQAFWALLGGYLSVWLLFSLPAAGLQLLLSNLGLVTVDGSILSGWLTTGLLTLAGIYQFTPIKEACLSKCRSPMAYFMGRWQPGVAGAYRMGLHHGAVCVGCCWALMLLGFVGGTMNPAWMFGAMILMIVEKLPDIGRYITAPLGIALLASAILVLCQTLGLI